MSTITSPQLLDQLHWRCAIKLFDPKLKISPSDWAALEDSLVLTPSSFGLQPWKFLVLSDPAVREKLVPVSWGQRQVADSSHFVVFAAKTNISEADIDTYLQSIASTRNLAVESLAPFRKMLVDNIISGKNEAERTEWAARQIYIALGNFMTSAALLGIDTCPLEGLEPEKYDEILDLKKQGLKTVVACAAGYRNPTDKYALIKKVRFPKSEVITHI